MPGGEDTLREVIETLAPLERRAGSDDERKAADWLRSRLQQAGCEARIEEEKFLDGWARQLVPLGLVGAAAGLIGLTRRGRGLAALTAVAAAAALVDDVSNGPRLWRRAVSEELPTSNVVAELGDPAAQRTLVVLAHHDAAQTGAVFDQSLQYWLGDHLPTMIARFDTSLPLWWPVVGAPALVALGSARGRRAMTAAGAVGCGVAAALGSDVARSPVVPGANDNLTGVAALVGLAERLMAEPVEGLRVMLVSCGAEEVLQGGIHGFASRHFPSLDEERTYVINLDTIGSPELILLEGEGCFVMEDYPVKSFRDLIALVAGELGEPLRRGCRSRFSTDSVVPARAGYPTATLSSWEPKSKCLSNYHLPTDVPENVNVATVSRAVDVVEGVARKLASRAAPAQGG